MKQNNIDTYGNFYYSDNVNYQSIHPDDINKVPGYLNGRDLLYCAYEDNEYVFLQYGEFSFRGKVKDYTILTKFISFYMNDLVREKDREPEVIGRIYRVNWHFERNIPIFFLEVEGKKKHRWYFEDDLELIEKADTDQG